MLLWFSNSGIRSSAGMLLFLSPLMKYGTSTNNIELIYYKEHLCGIGLFRGL
jgi:hypothetical protein